MQYGQNRPFEPGRPIELADAQTLDKADVTLPRGSVLSGRVLDEFGEPVADANVGAMRMQFVNGRRRLVNAGRNSQTNDLGQFRLYGLPPGEYYVSATLRSMDLAIGDMIRHRRTGGSSPNSGYAPTYYPGTASPADAQRVTVAVGQELGSIDIALAPVKLAKITGTAMGSDGKPLAGAMVMLMPAMRDGDDVHAWRNLAHVARRTVHARRTSCPASTRCRSRSTGAMFTDVGGTMIFSMATDRAGAPPPPPTRQEAEFASLPVSVAGDDVTGVVVVTTHGARAIGRLVFDGGAKPDNLTSVRVTAPSADLDGAPVPGIGNATVKDNGTFEIAGLVGVRVLRPLAAAEGLEAEERAASTAPTSPTRGSSSSRARTSTGIEIELTQKTTAIARHGDRCTRPVRQGLHGRRVCGRSAEVDAPDEPLDRVGAARSGRSVQVHEPAGRRRTTRSPWTTSPPESGTIPNGSTTRGPARRASRLDEGASKSLEFEAGRGQMTDAERFRRTASDLRPLPLLSVQQIRRLVVFAGVDRTAGAARRRTRSGR